MEFRSLRRKSPLLLSERKIRMLMDLCGFYVSEERDKVLTGLGPHRWRCSESHGVGARYL